MSSHLPELDTSMEFGWIGGPSARQLHITLHDVEPVVWRRIVVPSAMSLGDASRVFELAVGWAGYHLHAFNVGHLRFGRTDLDDPSMINESDVCVEQLWPAIGDAVEWNYDFGDDWTHTIVLETIVDLDDTTSRPACIAGAMAGPPEDCGGPWGYRHLLEVLADPKHDEHAQLKEWIPAGFDPAIFDPTEITAAVQSVL